MKNFMAGFGQEILKLAYDPFGPQTASSVGIPGALGRKDIPKPFKPKPQPSLGQGPGQSVKPSMGSGQDKIKPVAPKTDIQAKGPKPLGPEPAMKKVQPQPAQPAQGGASWIRNKGLRRQVQFNRQLGQARKNLLSGNAGAPKAVQ